MKWELLQVTESRTDTHGYRTGPADLFNGDESAVRDEIERIAESTGLKCFALRMDRRAGREHLRAPSGRYFTSVAGTI